MDGLRTVLSSQVMSELESDECAHAMTEERERLVQVWSEGLACEPYQFVYFSARRLGDARASSGQLNRTDFDRFRKILLPRTKDRISAAGVRKTEEAHTSSSIRFPIDKPGRSHGHDRTIAQ